MPILYTRVGMPIKNLTGQTFGKLIVLNQVHKQFHSIYRYDTDYYDLMEFTSSFIGLA